MKPDAEFFFNLAMFTSRTRLFRNNRDSLARLFVPVTLIRLFFRQWFTYFCGIYVFLLQFRIIKKKFLNAQFPYLNEKTTTTTNRFS